MRLGHVTGHARHGSAHDAHADHPQAPHTPATLPPHDSLSLARKQADLAYLAAMAGRKAKTLSAVQDLAADLPVPLLLAMKDSGWSLAAQYAALVRFGLWDELIALEAPDTRLAGLMAGYLYGRGVGLAARGRVAEARQTLGELQALGVTVPADTRAGTNPLRDIIAVAEPILAARIAASERREADAVTLLERAVAAEDQLAYSDPADWFFPARHLLGAQLLLAGQPAAAERVYTEDLKRNPSNGWSLFGLMLAAQAQGKTQEAARRANEQQRAWQRADVRLPGSAFWYAGADTASCECQHFPSAQGQPGGEFLGAQHEAGVH
jgi:tetratricopeptide (TPR) repeat protein